MKRRPSVSLRYWILGTVFLGSLVACGANGGGDPCSDPSPPLSCIECDPTPGAPDPCPAGSHCTVDGVCGQVCTPGGDECGPDAHCTDDGQCVADPPCDGLECFQVDCPAGGTTSLSGTVYAPNGTLPLYNVAVYVPNRPVEPLPTGLTCDRCGSVLSGSPLVLTTTDTSGNFTLTDVPATADVPLVIQVGRWRRQITIPSVPACTDTPLVADETRLPRNQSEGDLPRMALSTGGADALECLIRKIGIDDAEITTPSGTGRLHLYAGVGGTDQFDAGHGGASFPNATTLWNNLDSLDDYDIVFLSCEGGRNPNQKPMGSRQALKDFTDMGGRVFASHWHNIWLDAGPNPWPQTVTRVDLPDLNSIIADVDQTLQKGADLAQWLLAVGASSTLGRIAITAAQHTISAVNTAMADRWIYKDNTANGQPSVQYLSFTTPLEQPADMRCGRVVFSDIHVASGDDSDASLAYPSGGCTTNVDHMTPQEKVLAFMIFDIGSCIEDPIE